LNARRGVNGRKEREGEKDRERQETEKDGERKRKRVKGSLLGRETRRGDTQRDKF